MTALASWTIRVIGEIPFGRVLITAFVQPALSGVDTGDMLKSVHDTTNNGKVDVGKSADTVT